MNSTQFFQTYALYENDIISILRSKNIFDEDLLHDTMLALYEHTPHPAPWRIIRIVHFALMIERGSSLTI